MSRAHVLVLAGLTPLFALVRPASDESDRSSLPCSLVSVPTQRDPQATYFVATATSDEAVLAGLGTVKPSDLAGHWGPGTPREVYGQVVRVDSLGGSGAAAIAEAFTRRGTRTVVVVPWDYDPGCKPTYWTRGARWIEPLLTGFYTVRPRPEADWVRGQPTFDAFYADHQPYPHGPMYVAGYRGLGAARTRPALTPHELFSLYAALPVFASTRPDSSALEPVRRWRATHSDLATRYPADAILAALLR